MKSQLPQDGLGGLALLLGVAVLLVLGGIGMMVYNQNQTVNNLSQPVENPSTPTPEGVSTSPNGVPGGTQTPASSAPQKSGTVIKITAVGLQLTVPDSLKDLTYHTSSLANNSTLVTFSTKTITNSISKCAANSGQGAFSTVTRGVGNYPGPANPSSGGLLKQYGGYYFAYNLPTAPCATGLSVEQQNLLNDQTQLFYDSLGSAQAL